MDFQRLPGLDALLLQVENLLALLIAKSHRVEDSLGVQFRDGRSVLRAVEAAVGQDDQEGQAGAEVLVSVDLVIGVLPRLVELYRLDEVRHGFRDALAHSDGETVLIEQVNDGHQELPIVDLMLHSEQDHREAVANVDDVGIIGVLRIQHLQGCASTLTRNPVLRTLHLVEQRLQDQILCLLIFWSVSLINEATLKKRDESGDALIAHRLMRLVEEHVDDGDDDPFYRLGD